MIIVALQYLFDYRI